MSEIDRLVRARLREDVRQDGKKWCVYDEHGNKTHECETEEEARRIYKIRYLNGEGPMNEFDDVSTNP